MGDFSGVSVARWLLTRWSNRATILLTTLTITCRVSQWTILRRKINLFLHEITIIMITQMNILKTISIVNLVPLHLLFLFSTILFEIPKASLRQIGHLFAHLRPLTTVGRLQATSVSSEKHFRRLILIKYIHVYTKVNS